MCPRLAHPHGADAACAPLAAIDDWAFLARRWPQVALSRDAWARAAAADGALSWNAFQNAVLAHSDCFVTVQGGGSYLAAYFGGRNVVANFFGGAFDEARADDAAAGGAGGRRAGGEAARSLMEVGYTYSMVLPRLSNQTIVEVTNPSQLYAEIDRWHRHRACGLGVTPG